MCEETWLSSAVGAPICIPIPKKAETGGLLCVWIQLRLHNQASKQNKTTKQAF